MEVMEDSPAASRDEDADEGEMDEVSIDGVVRLSTQTKTKPKKNQVKSTFKQSIQILK